MMQRIRFLPIGLVLLLLGLAVSSQAADTPILQLDPGGHMATINDIAFTPDGRQLVSAGDDKVIRVWDIASGQTVRTLRGEIGTGSVGQIYAMALSPDGRWLAVGGWMAPYTGDNRDDVGAIRLYDFTSGELVARLKGHVNITVALAFSNDGRYLISGSLDKTAIVWDITQRQPSQILQGHKDAIYAVAFTADSQRAITGSEDSELRLEAGGRKNTRDSEGHQGPVEAVAVSSQGIIASSGSDRAIRLWMTIRVSLSKRWQSQRPGSAASASVLTAVIC
ncbi:MAG: WD40 repeat domain-containing protein [Candidatus Competibacteraceae bacterium]